MYGLKFVKVIPCEGAPPKHSNSGIPEAFNLRPFASIGVISSSGKHQKAISYRGAFSFERRYISFSLPLQSGKALRSD
jgi:hypothetical protein